MEGKRLKHSYKGEYCVAASTKFNQKINWFLSEEGFF